jgi:hypothetical protein
MSVWSEMNRNDSGSVFSFNDNTKDMAAALEIAIESPNIPIDILTKLLNMIEFVELHDKRLPIDIVKIGVKSRKAHAMAKSLRWREMEFSVRKDNEECIEALIAINNQLGLDDAAKGVLKCVSDGKDKREKWFSGKGGGEGGEEGGVKETVIKVKPSWQEKLGNWKEALNLYEQHINQRTAEGEEGGGGEGKGAEAGEEGGGGGTTRARKSTVKFGGSPNPTRASSVWVNNKTPSFDADVLDHEEMDVNEAALGEDLIEATIGQMRCLSALDKNEKVLVKSNSLWLDLNGLRKSFLQQQAKVKKGTLSKEKIEKWIGEVEVLGAKAAWAMNEWDELQLYMNGGRVGAGDFNEPDDVTSFFGAVLAIKSDPPDWEKAQSCINAAREKITPLLSSMLGDFS